jgi:hypothetical protein
VLFGVLTGIAEIVLALRAPEMFPRWAVAEGLVVIAMSYGVWRRNLPSAVVLLIIKVIASAQWWSHTGRAPNTTTIAQLGAYTLAAAAIFLGRQERRLQSPVGKSTSAGEESSDNRAD